MVEEEIIELEMTDIFEDMTEQKVKENIEFLLKSKKIWKKGWSIVFPAGALAEIKYPEVEGDMGSYQFDFEIFEVKRGWDRIVLRGTAYGNFQPKTNEIIDMIVELREGEDSELWRRLYKRFGRRR